MRFFPNEKRYFHLSGEAMYKFTTVASYHVKLRFLYSAGDEFRRLRAVHFNLMVLR